MDGAALPPVDVKNPFLVLAFMPAEIAMLYESMRFLFIATLAVRRLHVFLRYIVADDAAARHIYGTGSCLSHKSTRW
jgi:hypothetical protein